MTGTTGGTGATGQDGGTDANAMQGQTNAATGGTSGTGDFADLDRDDDNRLTPAEYAIHRLPSETAARQGATNDENPPFVSDEALNEVATRFSQLDTNGDFYLSEEEFRADT